MQLAAAKVTSAQEELAARAIGRARAVCRSLLGSNVDTADAVQASIEAILKSTGRFRGECSLDTWCERITVRTALRQARRRRRWHLVPVEAAPLEQAPEPPRSEDRLPRPLQAYLDALPESRRHALALRYRLDYSIEEIAEATGQKPDAVKYRLKQALAELRSLIRRDQNLGTGGPRR